MCACVCVSKMRIGCWSLALWSCWVPATLSLVSTSRRSLLLPSSSSSSSFPRSFSSQLRVSELSTLLEDDQQKDQQQQQQQQPEKEKPRDETTTTTLTTRQALKAKLPPIGTKQERTKLEIEFRELLEGILYTSQEIQAITNHRLRAIYEGIAASYYEPSVYRAFEVLYEDYAPLRIAGRIVYRKLKDNMEKSQHYQRDQIQSVLETTDLTMDEIESAWSVFVRLTNDEDDGREISSSALQRCLLDSKTSTIVAATAMSREELSAFLNPDNKKSLSFEEVMCGLFDAIPDTPPGRVLEELYNTTYSLQESDTVTEETTSALDDTYDDSDDDSYDDSDDDSLLLLVSKEDPRRAKFGQKYDNMLSKFGEWKEFIPDGEGRRLDILRGCFVGSENPKVVEALRIIYTDYRALRLSGDWIFKIVSTIMGATLERRRRQRRLQRKE